MWCDYHKFDSTRNHWGMSLMCQYTTTWVYIEHGLKHITFYVQKHIALWKCASSRQVARGACICETGLLPYGFTNEKLLWVEVTNTYRCSFSPHLKIDTRTLYLQVSSSDFTWMICYQNSNLNNGRQVTRSIDWPISSLPSSVLIWHGQFSVKPFREGDVCPGVYCEFKLWYMFLSSCSAVCNIIYCCIVL